MNYEHTFLVIWIDCIRFMHGTHIHLLSLWGWSAFSNIEPTKNLPYLLKYCECVCIRFIRVSFNPPSLLRSTHCSLFDIHFRSLHSGSMVHFELLTIFGHFTNTVWNTTIEQDNTIIDNDLVESQNVDNESMTTRIMPIRTTGPLLDEERSVCEWSVRTNTWWL